MFIEKWLEPILEPFRRIRSKWWGLRNIQGGLKGDVSRAKRTAAQVKNAGKDAVGKAKGAQAKAKDAASKAKAAGDKAKATANQAKSEMGQIQGQMPNEVGKPGAVAGQAGAGGRGGVITPASGQQGSAGHHKAPPPKKAGKKMGLFGKKKTCPECGQPQEKDWPECPFCAEQEQAAAPAAAPQKTMCMMAGGGMTAPTSGIPGWIVPLEGPQRGELFCLKAMTSVGTDPTSDIVLMDPYMSSRHAVIRGNGAGFQLEDLGSTNGTFVNDKRIKSQELLDNDFIRFGKTLAKFKVL